MKARAVMVGLALAPLFAGCGGGGRVTVGEGGRAVGAPPAAVGPQAEERTAVPVPEPRGSEDWRIEKPARDGQLAAYTTRASGLPGTRIGLKVSTTQGG